LNKIIKKASSNIVVTKYSKAKISSRQSQENKTEKQRKKASTNFERDD